jgi:hypothetical protein
MSTPNDGDRVPETAANQTVSTPGASTSTNAGTTGADGSPAAAVQQPQEATPAPPTLRQGDAREPPQDSPKAAEAGESRSPAVRNDWAIAISISSFVVAIGSLIGTLYFNHAAMVRDETRMEREQKRDDLTRKTLQAEQQVKIIFAPGHTDQQVTIRNVSRVSAEKVEFIVRRSAYSPKCDRIVMDNIWGNHTVPWKQVDVLKPGEILSVALKDLFTDNFIGALKSNDIGCPKLVPEVAVEVPTNRGDADWRAACAPEAPCLGLLYVEVRAMHPKTFEWHGPFKEYFRVEADGTLTSSDLLGGWGVVTRPTERKPPKAWFKWNRLEDKQVFTALQRQDQDDKKWLRQQFVDDTDDRDDGSPPLRPFHGFGLDRVLREGQLPDDEQRDGGNSP